MNLKLPFVIIVFLLTFFATYFVQKYLRHVYLVSFVNTVGDTNANRFVSRLIEATNHLAFEEDNINPTLFKELQSDFLIKPPHQRQSPKLVNDSIIYRSQVGQDQVIQKLVKNLTNGIFVEAGAFDGEHFSNTLFLEQQLNWTGLLVEPDPEKFAKLKSKRRNAYISNAFLSPKAYPIEIPQGKCYPLYWLLLATEDSRFLNITLLSLDVDGMEMDIIRTIPWDRVRIWIVLIEVMHYPIPLDVAELGRIVEYFGHLGYRVYRDFWQDLLLVHRDF